MSPLIRTLPLIALLQIGTAVGAQESEAADTTSDDTAAEAAEATDTADQTGDATETEAGQEAQDRSDVASELDLGREVEPSYIKEQYGDWQIQCFRTETGEDPCQMYQLLREEGGNPVAEFSVFKLPPDEQSQAVAGATIVVPLGTLLTEGLKISVDQGPIKAYNYAFCSMGGCFARIGFTEEDVDAFKAGASAVLSLVPAQAPDQLVNIEASLDGFTAAFNEASVADN